MIFQVQRRHLTAADVAQYCDGSVHAIKQVLTALAKEGRLMAAGTKIVTYDRPGHYKVVNVYAKPHEIDPMEMPAWLRGY